SVATLTVIVDADRVVRVVNGAGSAGGSASVAVELCAQGNENAAAFSLLYDSALLSFTSVALGSGASNASLNINTNQVSSGRLGLSLALGAGQTFSSGTQQLVVPSFAIAGTAPD